MDFFDCQKIVLTTVAGGPARRTDVRIVFLRTVGGFFDCQKTVLTMVEPGPARVTDARTDGQNERHLRRKPIAKKSKNHMVEPKKRSLGSVEVGR